MQQNENKPIFYNDVADETTKEERLYVQSENITSMQVGAAPLVLDLTRQITIPKGYRWNGSTPITEEVTIDQHLLHVVASLLRPATNDFTPIYSATLLGTLPYNVVLRGFIASAPIIAGENARQAVFNSSGSVALNDILGYGECVSEIMNELNTSFAIELYSQFPSVVLADGTVITYNPDNPSEFFSLFDGSAPYTYIYRVTAVITSTLGPNS